MALKAMIAMKAWKAQSYDSYEGLEGSDGFEKLSGMYFGRLCAIVALKGFGAPFIRNLVVMGLKAMIAMKALKAQMALKGLAACILAGFARLWL